MATAGQRWFGFRELHKHLINAIERFVEDDMMTYAAAIAFQMFFSLFAFVIFLIALLGFLRIPGSSISLWSRRKLCCLGMLRG